MRYWLIVVLVLLSACSEREPPLTVESAAVAAEFEASAPRPNIIHLMADDLGYSEVGVFGQEKIQTPHIDQLAREGMRLTQHYAGSALCSPARWSYMTGQHAGSSGVTGNGYNLLPPEADTLSRMLQKAGYTTALAGKWALGIPGSDGDPLRQGFDSWYGYRDQSEAHDYYPEWLYHNGEKERLVGNVASDEKYVSAEKVSYAPDAIQDWVLSFIARAGASKKPFYLQLHYNLPHLNNELLAIDGIGAEYPEDGRYVGTGWPQKHQSYAEMVSVIDDYVGALVEALKQRGIAEKTLIIFTSDNGPTGARGLDSLGFFGATGSLRGMKGMLLEGGIRVPAIVWWPGHIDAGSESDAPSAFWDMMPTYAELAGVTPPQQSDGVSQAGLWQGGDVPNRAAPLFWRVGNWTALRQGSWKWLRFENKDGVRERLFNVDKDPAEQHDQQQAQPELFQRLRAQAGKWVEFD